MAFCTECGKENRQEARFCRFCGTSLEEPWSETPAIADIAHPAEFTDNFHPDNMRLDIEKPADVETLNSEVEEHLILAEMSDAPSVDEGEAVASLPTQDAAPLVIAQDQEDNALEMTAEAATQDTISGIPSTPPPSEETAEQPIHSATALVALPESPVLPLLEPLPAGSLIMGRYKVIRGSLDADGVIAYEAEDTLLCWNCQAVQSSDLFRQAGDAHYCEVCGAELTKKVVISLRASLLSAADKFHPGEIPSGDGGQSGNSSDDSIRRLGTSTPLPSGAQTSSDWFVEDDITYQVLRPVDSSPRIEPVYLRLASGYLSDPGKARGNNEDSLIVFQLAGLCELGCPGAAGSSEMSSASTPVAPPYNVRNMGFYAVADGVGGYAAGEVASQATVQSLASNILQEIFVPALNNSELPFRSITEPELEQKFKEAVLVANQVVMEMRVASPEKGEMGSTLTAVLVRSSDGYSLPKAIVANVGDSRTYLMRKGKLTPITRDHSLVATLVEQGTIKPEEAYIHEQRNVIYRSLGDKPDLVVDTQILELEPGDRLLLCSDGLWEMVRDPYIEDILLERLDPQQACQQLVDMANLAGGEDNISAVVVNVDIFPLI
jgi:serine/threonine protein phosphatase PrpC